MKRRIAFTAGILFVIAIMILICFSDNKKSFETKTVCGEICNLRSGPGEEFRVLGFLLKNEEVIVSEKIRGIDGKVWYKIDKKALPNEMNVSSGEYYILEGLLK